MRQATHQAGAYRGFGGMKLLKVFLLLPGWDASSMQLPSALNLPSTQLYTWVERGTEHESKVPCPKTQHNDP